MRHFKFAPLVFLLACTERQAPTKITVDVGQFAQMQVPVSSLGLLVLTAPLADAAAQEDRAASDAGETISTSAPPPPGAGSVTIGDPKPPMNTGARGADAPSGPQTGAVAVPETEPNAAGQPPPPPVFYTEVALDAGTSTFSVDVPSGPHQSLFLYGFGAPAAADKAPIPNYVAAAVNVALQAGAEQTVRFKMYPAGVVVPQILKPSLVGLVDANNQPIAKVPDDLSCLAVAHAQAPRDGFPVDMVAKIRVGSITQASQLGPASVLVLPVGDYQLSCFAQFAGKLFAVNPPVAVHVDKGKVSVATGTLVKVRDLVVAGGGTGGTAGGTGPGGTTVPGDNTTAPPGSDGTQVTPPGSAQPPRFSVYISPPSASPARQNMTGELGALNEEPNFDNTTDMNVTVVARRPDGSIDFDYNNEVVLKVTPAIDRTLKGTEKASGGIWQPFATQTGTLRMPVLGGSGVSPIPLRLGQLAVPTGAVAADRATM